MWIPTRRNKGFPSYLGCSLNPDVVWKCSCAASRDSSALFVSTCLNCTWRKCCCVLSGRSLRFVHPAPIFGICEGVKPEQPGMEGWVPGWSWIAVESLAAFTCTSQALGTRTAAGLATANPQHQLGSCFSCELVQHPSAKQGRWKRARWQWFHLC